MFWKCSWLVGGGQVFGGTSDARKRSPGPYACHTVQKNLHARPPVRSAQWPPAQQQLLREDDGPSDPPQNHSVEQPDVFNESAAPVFVAGLSPSLLGSASGDSENGFAIANGAFQGWPVARNAQADPSSRRHTNVHGWMRGGGVNSPLVVRFPSYCGREPAPLDDDDVRAESCAVADNIETWSACASALHNRLHRYIGGATNCSLDAEPEEIARAPRPSPAPVASAVEAADRQTEAADATAAVGPYSLIGDFESSVSSVNDPIFFFVHSFFDRQLLSWQVHRSGGPPACAENDDASWRPIFDALQTALAPCRHDGRWDNHRFAKILFHQARAPTPASRSGAAVQPFCTDWAARCRVARMQQPTTPSRLPFLQGGFQEFFRLLDLPFRFRDVQIDGKCGDS